MNRIDLKGKRAVITGAAKGIGEATAERFADYGAALSLWDRDGPALSAVAERLAGKAKVHALTVDVADSAAVNAAAEEAEQAVGPIDIMIANAGIAGIIKPAWEFTDAEWRQLIDMDLNSVFYSCRAVLPGMVERGYGRIVVVSSIAGMEGAANNAAYSSAKAGAVGFTKALGKELAKSGVIVNCVTPSGIDTPLLGDVTPEYLETVTSKMPIGRLGTADECAAMIAWLASEDCSFTTGAVFDLSGGRAVY